MQRLKYLLFSFIAVTVFFALFEIVFRFFVPSGSSDFIERTIIQQGLEVKKKPGEYRIFLFGESTMHGNHLFPESTIKRWMELYLENLVGKEKAEQVTIINFGRLGEDSLFMLQSLKETSVYRPDLVIVYSAHNDFIQLEHRDRLLRPASFSNRVEKLFKELGKKIHFVSAIRRMSVRAKIVRSQRKDAQKQASDEWFDETEKKIFNPARDFLVPGSINFKKVYENWRGNILKISDEAQSRGVQIIFLNGVRRHKDFPPFASVHESSLSKEQIETWQETIDRAKHYYAEGQYEEAKLKFSEALALDMNYAETYYQLAQTHEKLDNYEEAYRLYNLADDHDYFPVRAPSVVNEFYGRLAAEKRRGVDVIDTERLFRENSSHGLIGEDLIVDQIHPTMEGQALIAKEILKRIYDNDLIFSKSDWQWEDFPTVAEVSTRLGLDADFDFRICLSSAKYVGSYHARAIDFLNRALAIKPNSITARSHLAWRYWQMEEREKSVAIYRRLLEDVPAVATAFLDKYPEIKDAVLISRP